jgi:hypothetical protein
LREAIEFQREVVRGVSLMYGWLQEAKRMEVWGAGGSEGVTVGATGGGMWEDASLEVPLGVPLEALGVPVMLSMGSRRRSA